jgi:hypothetical protein
MDLHLNLTQDIGNGITIIFICCILTIIACLIDLWTGVDAARKNGERIRSKALRRTVAKAIDYLRIILFAVLIDVLGLCFIWYAIPYCAVVCTLGILLIEGKSVLENYRKRKSSAAEVVDMLQRIVECADNDTAKAILEAIKKDGNSRKKDKRQDDGKDKDLDR